MPNVELIDILNKIDTTRIQATIQKLTTFGTRHTLSPNGSSSWLGLRTVPYYGYGRTIYGRIFTKFPVNRTVKSILKNRTVRYG